MRNQGNARGFSHALLVGKLGRPIAHRLLLAGRDLLVFDKDAAHRAAGGDDRAAKTGTERGNSPASGK